MTEAKFTPGPWKTEYGKVYHYNGLYITRDVGFEKRGYVARMDDSTHAAIERAANAHLIAAAPELYEVAALVAGVDFLGDESLFSDDDLVMVSVGTVRKAIAALANARGETAGMEMERGDG